MVTAVPPEAKPQAGRATIVSVAMVALIAAELLARISGNIAVQAVAWIAASCVVLGARRALGLRESYLLVLCAVLTVLLLLWNTAPGQSIARALNQATFLMTFILLIGLLHEAASSSPSVEKCGQYLTRQPPARRYYALYFGTGAMAVLFNLGIVSFLVPLVQRGIAAATPGDANNPIRERRQVGALLRGFAWSVIWSPTAIAPLALVELIPGTNRPLWIGLGFGIYILIMIFGALEDRIRYRALVPANARPAEPFPLRAALMFLTTCLVLFGLILLAMWVTDDTLVFGLMLACPLTLIGWLGVQYAQNDATGLVKQTRAAAALTARRLRSIVTINLPGSAPVAVTLACSGYVGMAAAALVPADGLAEALGLYAMPDFILLSLVPIALCLLSLLALSPIMTAVFFGSLFGSLDVLPADPTLIALSISSGWALSMTFSPFATVVLMIDRVAGIPPRTVTWKWNMAHSLLSAALLVPVFGLLTLWM